MKNINNILVKKNSEGSGGTEGRKDGHLHLSLTDRVAASPLSEEYVCRRRLVMMLVKVGCVYDDEGSCPQLKDSSRTAPFFCNLQCS